MSYTEEELKNFDWNAAVNTHLHMACAALNDLCVRPSGRETMSVGPLQCYVGLRGDIIPLCHKCGKAPRARHDSKSVLFGCECGDLKDNFVVGDTCSAQHLFSMWAKMQMFFCSLKNNVLDMRPCITALAANGYERKYDGMAKNEYTAMLARPLDTLMSAIDAMAGSERLDCTMEGYAIVFKDIVKQMLKILK